MILINYIQIYIFIRTSLATITHTHHTLVGVFQYVYRFTLLKIDWQIISFISLGWKVGCWKLLRCSSLWFFVDGKVVGNFSCINNIVAESWTTATGRICGMVYIKHFSNFLSSLSLSSYEDGHCCIRMANSLITSCWAQSHNYELRFSPKYTTRETPFWQNRTPNEILKSFFNQTLWYVMAMINMHTWNINSFIHCNTDATHLCTLSFVSTIK